MTDKIIATIAAWVVDNIPLPARLQPWVFGLIIGRTPVKHDEGRPGNEK